MRFIIYFLFFTLNLSNSFGCECFDYKRINSINGSFQFIRNHVRSGFYYDIVESGHKDPWQMPYIKEYRELKDRDANISYDLNRYPSVIHKLNLLEERVDLVGSYWHEQAWQSYLGPEAPWNRSTLAQKEARAVEDQAGRLKSLSKVKDKLAESRDEITVIYQELFEACLKKHASLTTYFDYGLLGRLYNNYDISMDMMHKLLDEAEKTGQLDSLDSLFYQELGSSCVEAMNYEKAIDYLSKAIEKDPENKEAYFERAIAYFETGNFDLAHLDYISSDKGKPSLAVSPVSLEFSSALMLSTALGVKDGAIEFAPNLCSSAYGIGEALWVSVQEPIHTSKQFMRACHEMGSALQDYCKNVDWDTVDGYVEQVKTLYQLYDQLSDKERGELIGYTIGKYGVEIFAGGAALKGIQAARNLRNVNRLCNLESLATNAASKEALVASACKHNLEREAFFKNVKIHVDRQNKHIVGKHNFEAGKSVWEHPDPERLLREFAGKGRKVNDKLEFSPRYREVVDFNEPVGFWECITTKQRLSTTKGTIHYGQGTAHIVPAHPTGILR